jgi:hypothetical protein
LQLFELKLPEGAARYSGLLSQAKLLLSQAKRSPSPSLDSHSPAELAVDRYASRRLNAFMPLRPIELPPQEQCWGFLDDLLNEWSEIISLSAVTDLTTWNVSFGTQIALPSSLRTAFSADCQRSSSLEPSNNKNSPFCAILRPSRYFSNNIHADVLRSSSRLSPTKRRSFIVSSACTSSTASSRRL